MSQLGSVLCAVLLLHTELLTALPTTASVDTPVRLTTGETRAGAGTNGTLTLCTTSGVADLFAALGGDPDSGGSWTAPGGAACDATFDPAADPPGVYTYTVPCAPSPCVPPSATVTVTVNIPPSAGTNGAISTCSNTAAFDLFTYLGGSPNPGGAWTGPGGTPVASTFTPGTSTPGVYTYTVLGAPPCSNASAIVTVSVVSAPDPGVGTNFTVCSNANSFALFSRLGGTPQAGGAWVGPGGVHGPTFVPGTDVPGNYTYTVSGTAPCVAASATLVISVQNAPKAGTNASTTVCSTDASFGLFSILGGTPDGGGSWTAPGGGSFSGTFVPGTSMPGTYTYTVAGVAPCSNASASVTVAVNAAPNAGTNSTVTRCSNAAAFNLFSLLGGTPAPGGAWVGPAGASSGTFTPGTNQPGPYTYTVAGVAPCANASAVVTVNIVAEPVAGTNGTTTVCASDAPFPLVGFLGGSPQAGGSWSAPGGGASNGTFTPGTSAPGAFTYTVAGNPPCLNATSTVTVSMVQPPNPGGAASITVCSNAPAVALFGILTGTPAPGGTWMKPDGSAHSGTLLPASDPAGTYTYTVLGNAPCSARSSTVQVAKVQAPDAGTNGSITVCSTMAAFQLFTVLGGTPSGAGTWRTPANAPFSGAFTPGTTPAGIYKYVVNGAMPCANDTAFVTVVVNVAPNAGINASHTVCSSQTAFNLLTRLGGSPNAGGTWTGPNDQPFIGPYVPGTSQPGAYTYTVAGQTPCSNASAVVAITEYRQPMAGTGTALSLCSTDGPVTLFNALGATPDPGGNWTAPGGSSSTGIFMPASGAPGVYTYALNATAPCVTASANVAITVNQAPDAGEDMVVSVCADGGAVDLFDALAGTPDTGGAWTDDDATGHLSGGLFSPTGMAPGDYDFTYTVPGNGQCGADLATVRVTIVAALDAGTNGSLTVCGSNSLVNLFPGLGGTPQPGGTWVDLSGTSALTGQFFNSTLVPAGTYNFRYELSGSASCTADQALVSVTVIAPRQPGNNASITTCSTSGSFSLFPLLTGNPQSGGTWSPGNGTYDPVAHTPGVFTYSLTGTAPCPNAIASVTVVEVAAPNAGTSAVATVCSSDGPFNMTLRLGGAPQPGVWSFGGVPRSNVFTPGVDAPGVYVYTVAGVAPCSNAMASLTVNVNLAPNAGANGDTTVCGNGSSFALFDQLSGGAMPGGTWTKPGGGTHSGFYQPPTDAPGSYIYTLIGVTPCPADVAVVTVTENPVPNAGVGGPLALCSGGPSVALFTTLTGSPSANGTWTGPAPSTAVFNGSFIPGVTTPGTYTYTVLGVPPCLNATAAITVSVVSPPNAGTSRSITICDSATPFAMVDQLAGSPALGGMWTGPAPSTAVFSGFFLPGTTVPGSYTYTVSGSSPCPNATATLNVVVNPRANAGVNATLPLCSNSGARPMFPLLGTGAQVGGTWKRQSTGVAHSGVFQPGTDLSGVFVYIVQGPIGCGPDSAAVAVTVNQEPNAGFNGQVIVCDDQLPLQLVNLLNGTPQLNGLWRDPALASHTGIYVPDQSLPGVYTYVVSGIAPCANAQAQVNVIENDHPDAGGNGTRIICSSDQPFALASVLTGTPDAGGVWTGPSGATVGSQFIPGTSLPGVYKYRIQGLAPCQSDSATATIVVNQAVVAGISTVQQICSSSAQVALIDLLGGAPATSGSWSFGNNPHSQFFDPAIDGSGAYVYTVVGLAPCPNRVAQVQVTKVLAPDAGSNGTIAACVGDAIIQLASGLGGAPNAGGTWTDVDGTGQLSSGVLNATSLAPGTYHFTYTVAGSGPCAAANATVTVLVSEALDAGENSSATVCKNQLVDLFALLGGTPQAGGAWTDLDGSGALIAGVFNGASLAANSTWHFRYAIPTTSSCQGDTAIVTILLEDGPFAGCDGFKAFCMNEAPGQLISALGCNPDAGGFWVTPSGAIHPTGVFQPAVDTPGVYKYVVPAVGGCAADTAWVTVEVRQPPNAGSDGSVSICSTDALVNLFSVLGSDAQSGGQWTLGGVLVSGLYNPAVDVPGTYLYRVVGLVPCPAAVAAITVAEPVAPYAGEPATITICSSDAPFNMRLQLGGLPQQGGDWYTASGASHTTTFNPGADAGGVYTYVVSGTAPCANDTAELTINRAVAPYAGQSATIAACASQDSVNLFSALGMNVGTGGVWSDLGLSGGLSGDVFNPTLAGNGTWAFQYAIAAMAPCTNAVSIVTVEVGSGANAGSDTALTICGGDTEFDLFQVIGGEPDTGGHWTALAGAPGLLPDGRLNATLLPIGGQNAFVYTIDDPGCGTVQATVLITTVEYPDPGSAADLVLCASAAPISLADHLTGTPDTGGVWSGPMGVFDGVLDPATHASGTYAYTMAGNSYCLDTSAVFSITINQPPDAGLPAQLVVCDTLVALPLLPALNGTPDSGGVWSDPDGSGGLSNGSLNTTVLDAGVYEYLYTVAVQGCGSTSTLLKVEVVSNPTVVDLRTSCNELDRTYVVTFTIQGGDPSSYVVSGEAGSLTTNAPFVFTSMPLVVSRPFVAVLTDAHACTPIRIETTTPCSFETEVFVPESFSPNGDGTNENFVIPGIEGFPDNTITIFNRWGAQLYTATGYDNRSVVWDGSSPDAMIPGSAATGTYFYVLDLGIGREPMTGFIQLVR